MISVPTSAEVKLKSPVWADIVPLPENRSALLAAKRAIKRLTSPEPTKSLTTPLVIHGGTGVGKTLLLGAMVKAVTSHPEGLTARVVAARELPRRKNDEPDGENQIDFEELVHVDFLAIEDVQHLSTKAIPDLVLLLDERLTRRRLTAISASHGPAQLKRFPRRLTSRMASGLVVQIEPIGRASRKELLLAQLFRKGLRLTDDAIVVLLDRTKGGGVRPMLGLVETLKTLTGRKTSPNDLLTADTVTSVLDSGEVAHADGPMQVLMGRVARHFGLSSHELLGASRRRDVLHPRQIAMYLAREILKLSLPQIGVAFNGRDHTTVLHACRKIATEAKSDRQLARTLRDLRGELE
jgi:chromosomal replication initiator protein